ncbi:MAG: L-2-hydroxyglutarate oxidase [Pseudomonadales bacterium]|nr:L-2-hydroxyglutarate oxidase [Pseudomonadales bacterium]
MIHDFTVVGGGILGLSTAWQLARRHPSCRIILLEKETALATHQSGRNSGVIHAGVYYAPGSLKARLCREGAAATRQFCAEHRIATEVCGKLIVATDTTQLPRLEALHERASANGIANEWLQAGALLEREPRVRGAGALWVPGTAIVDYRAVCAALAGAIRDSGAEIVTGSEVLGMREQHDQVLVHTTTGEIRTRWLLACAGLQSDRLAMAAGLAVDFRIVPFRGEYFRLAPHLDNLVQHLIYPVPDPALPFLGVHLTRTIEGGITVGPNALASLSREGYGRADFSIRDACTTIGFGGTWRFARRHLRYAARELRNSWWRRGYLREIQRYCPEVQLQDLQPHPVGIRAQALRRDGSTVEDFLFLESPRTLHVCNAPSPAATSALPIGAHLCARLEAKCAHAGFAVSPAG